MIGNSAPVKLAEFVSVALKLAIEDSYKIDFANDDFTTWLVTTQGYFDRTVCDTISRMKRADKIYHISGQPSALYLYELQRSSDFNNLSTSVRSQIKRATSLCYNYCKGSRWVVMADIFDK